MRFRPTPCRYPQSGSRARGQGRGELACARLARGVGGGLVTSAAVHFVDAKGLGETLARGQGEAIALVELRRSGHVECNGLALDDPSLPYDYAYFATDTFPYFLGCYRGTPDAANLAGGAGR